MSIHVKIVGLAEVLVNTCKALKRLALRGRHAGCILTWLIQNSCKGNGKHQAESLAGLSAFLRPQIFIADSTVMCG